MPSPWISGRRMHSTSVKFCRSTFMGSLCALYKRLDVVCIVTVPESTLCLRKVCLFIQPIGPLGNVNFAQQSPTAVPWCWTIPSLGLLSAFPRKKMLLGQNFFPGANANVFAVVPSHKWQTLTCNLFAECTEM